MHNVPPGYSVSSAAFQLLHLQKRVCKRHRRRVTTFKPPQLRVSAVSPPFLSNLAISRTSFPAKQMAGERQRKFRLTKHDLCVQGDSGAQMGAEHPKPLIYDERKWHETGITCPADTARLLLAYETLIYSSERMLTPPHNARVWFGPV